jgi:hypothetical protein
MRTNDPALTELLSSFLDKLDSEEGFPYWHDPSCTSLDMGTIHWDDDPWSTRSWTERNLGGTVSIAFRILEVAHSSQHHQGKGLRSSHLLRRNRASRNTPKYTGRLTGKKTIFLYQTF